MSHNTFATTTEDAVALSESTDCDSNNSADAFDEEQLFQQYLYLVRNAVNRIKRVVPAHIEAEELYSVGVAALMATIRKFTPDRAGTFAGFANVRIRGAILDELRRMDTCSRRTRERARKFEAATNAVEQELGRTATPAEVSSALGISREEYLKRLEEMKPIRLVTLDSEIDRGDESGLSLHELLADPTDETGRDRLEKAELLEMVTDRIAELPERSRKLLAMYYVEKMTFGTIAEALNVTESRVCQIHQSALAVLRKLIKSAR